MHAAECLLWCGEGGCVCGNVSLSDFNDIKNKVV